MSFGFNGVWCTLELSTPQLHRLYLAFEALNLGSSALGPLYKPTMYKVMNIQPK